MPPRPLHALVLVALLAVAAPAATAAPPPADAPLLVGAATDHYPYSYLDANHTLTGFAVDLLDEVARVGGLNIRRITGTSADLNRRFFAGEFPVAQVYTYSPSSRLGVAAMGRLVRPDAGRRDRGIRRTDWDSIGPTEPARGAQLLQRPANDRTRGLHPILTRLFPGEGEVADESTKAFLTAYMEEFRTYIARVLTVIPRE